MSPFRPDRLSGEEVAGGTGGLRKGADGLCVRSS